MEQRLFVLKYLLGRTTEYRRELTSPLGAFLGNFLMPFAPGSEAVPGAGVVTFFAGPATLDILASLLLQPRMGNRGLGAKWRKTGEIFYNQIKCKMEGMLYRWCVCHTVCIYINLL